MFFRTFYNDQWFSPSNNMVQYGTLLINFHVLNLPCISGGYICRLVMVYNPFGMLLVSFARNFFEEFCVCSHNGYWCIDFM